MNLLWLIFVAVVGACVGSFLNVVIYRLPEGKSLWWPPSSCPRCGHRLAVYDNVPVLGWLWLRGKCRYCRARISAQYPIIEAICAALFAGLFWVYYSDAGVREAFASAGVNSTWPVFLVHAALLAGLLAATVIDGRIFIIPLEIPYFIVAVALPVLPLSVWWLAPRVADSWALAQVWPVLPDQFLHGSGLKPVMAAAAAGGTVGLGVSMLLLRLGALPRSFDEDEQAHDVALPGLGPAAPSEIAPSALDAAPSLEGGPVTEAGSGGEVLMGSMMADAAAPPLEAALPVVIPPSPPSHAGGEPGFSREELEEAIVHPYLKREIGKEVLFLLAPLLGVVAAGWWARGQNFALPIGVNVLAGVVAGYLVGAGMVWLTRVLGSLAFGKEAMGLGDVHLLGAIGAVVGAADVVFIFFLAPFLGLAFALIAAGARRILSGQFRVIPYGPFLAMATLLWLALEDPISVFLSWLVS